MRTKSNNIITELAIAFKVKEDYVRKIVRGDRYREDILEAYKTIKSNMDKVVNTVKSTTSH